MVTVFILLGEDLTCQHKSIFYDFLICVINIIYYKVQFNTVYNCGMYIFHLAQDFNKTFCVQRWETMEQ